MIDEDDVPAMHGGDETSGPASGDERSSSALDRLDHLDPSGRGTGPSRRERRRQRRDERWTRPVVRDWRWGVRLVGRSLIVIGLLMFGFVAYQLWGTGIETSRAQNRLESEFAELLAEAQARRVDDTDWLLDRVVSLGVGDPVLLGHPRDDVVASIQSELGPGPRVV